MFHSSFPGFSGKLINTFFRIKVWSDLSQSSAKKSLHHQKVYISYSLRIEAKQAKVILFSKLNIH